MAYTVVIIKPSADHWNHENLLKQLDLPGGVHNYFSYDADSKRVTKQDSEGFTRFLYQGPDMLKLLQERDANGSLVTHYTMGQGLEAMRRGSVSRFYHYDWLGSTFELTDASGTVTDSYLYNAWGEVLARTGTTVNPHNYVGRARYNLSPDVPLQLLGLRYCWIGLGRFLSVDPAALVGQQGMLNYRPVHPLLSSVATRDLFEYVMNQPTVALDPTGLYRLNASCSRDDRGKWVRDGLAGILQSGVVGTFLACLENELGGLTRDPAEWLEDWQEAKGRLQIGCGDDCTCCNMSRFYRGVACGHGIGQSGIQLCHAALWGNPQHPHRCDWPKIGCTFLHEQVHLFLGVVGHKQAAVRKCWPHDTCPDGGRQWTS